MTPFPESTTVLLIDDDEYLLESLRGAVEAAGLGLRTANTWDEGLALFQAISPDLVIADYNLPGSKHGIQLLMRMRQLRPSVRLILLSGYVNDDYQERVENLGLVDLVLQKGSHAVEVILDEVRNATAAEQTPTSWQGFAHSFQTAEEVSADKVNELDASLRSKIEG